MSNRRTTRERGFSLMEMMVSMALGSIVLAASVQMYTKSLGATWLVGQRAEMQQDFRAASNMLTKDLSLAGAGLVNGAAIALPSGTHSPVWLRSDGHVLYHRDGRCLCSRNLSDTGWNAISVRADYGIWQGADAQYHFGRH